DQNEINLKTTNSAASSGRHSVFCPANRYSIVKFFPSTQPSLFISFRNASRRTAIPEAVLESRKPTRKVFPCCCADDGTQTAKNMAQNSKQEFVFSFVPSNV